MLAAVSGWFMGREMLRANLWRGLGAILLSMSSTLTWGQTADTAAAHALEEIVITAQRRTETLQTVPIAVTALSGGQLAGKAVASVTDLQYATPSLSIGNSGLT